jgi:hypothetical protein
VSYEQCSECFVLHGAHKPDSPYFRYLVDRAVERANTFAKIPPVSAPGVKEAR